MVRTIDFLKRQVKVRHTFAKKTTPTSIFSVKKLTLKLPRFRRQCTPTNLPQVKAKKPADQADSNLNTIVVINYSDKVLRRF